MAPQGYWNYLKGTEQTPTMRSGKPIWSARPSLWESPRRALIACRAGTIEGENAFISKSLISRGNLTASPKTLCANPANREPQKWGGHHTRLQRTRSRNQRSLQTTPRQCYFENYRHGTDRKRGETLGRVDHLPRGGRRHGSGDPLRSWPLPLRKLPPGPSPGGGVRRGSDAAREQPLEPVGRVIRLQASAA